MSNCQTNTALSVSLENTCTTVPIIFNRYSASSAELNITSISRCVLKRELHPGKSAIAGVLAQQLSKGQTAAHNISIFNGRRAQTDVLSWMRLLFWQLVLSRAVPSTRLMIFTVVPSKGTAKSLRIMRLTASKCLARSRMAWSWWIMSFLPLEAPHPMSSPLFASPCRCWQVTLARNSKRHRPPPTPSPTWQPAMNWFAAIKCRSLLRVMRELMRS